MLRWWMKPQIMDWYKVTRHLTTALVSAKDPVHAVPAVSQQLWITRCVCAVLML